MCLIGKVTSRQQSRLLLGRSPESAQLPNPNSADPDQHPYSPFAIPKELSIRVRSAVHIKLFASLVAYPVQPKFTLDSVKFRSLSRDVFCRHVAFCLVVS
ncbi:hypothetical protein CLAIMM_06900 isoform 1 [Cladophialophora immunda]|nr:hypothetical protein CLAIMM_06900 isoform 1 [Cladophialophora immunda]